MAAASETAEIPQPMVEVVRHVCIKTAQATSLACLASVPLFMLVRRGGLQTVDKVARISTRVFFLGAAAGVPLAYGRLKDEPEIAIFDRAYRLRYNSGQLRADRFSAYGLAAGGALGALRFLRVRDPLVVLGYAVFGCAGGLLAHVAIPPSVIP